MRRFMYWLDDHMPETFLMFLIVIVLILTLAGVTS